MSMTIDHHRQPTKKKTKTLLCLILEHENQKSQNRKKPTNHTQYPLSDQTGCGQPTTIVQYIFIQFAL